MAQLLNNLNALVVSLFLLTSFAILSMRQMLGILRTFIVQSFLLALSAVLLGLYYNCVHLYEVAVVNAIGKVIIIPWLLRRTIPSQIFTRREVDQALTVPSSLLIALGLATFAYFIGNKLSGMFVFEFLTPNIAVGMAVLLLSAFTMTVRREAVPLLISVLAMENGVFLAGIYMACDMPMLVDLAVAVDGLVIVLITGILTRTVEGNIGTTQVGRLSSLKEEFGHKIPAEGESK